MTNKLVLDFFFLFLFFRFKFPVINKTTFISYIDTKYSLCKFLLLCNYPPNFITYTKIL